MTARAAARPRRRSIRALMGVVSQDAVLLNNTVFANIAYGSPAASRERVEAAAEAANATGFIRQLPQGFDTVLGETPAWRATSRRLSPVFTQATRGVITSRTCSTDDLA